MIYYITGGARSGKSAYAQKLALQLSNNPIYLATARNWDADFNERIKRHQADRDERWENIEEEKHLSRIDFANRVVVVGSGMHDEFLHNHGVASIVITVVACVFISFVLKVVVIR